MGSDVRMAKMGRFQFLIFAACMFLVAYWKFTTPIAVTIAITLALAFLKYA